MLPWTGVSRDRFSFVGSMSEQLLSGQPSGARLSLPFPSGKCAYMERGLEGRVERRRLDSGGRLP
jgi:hypothetical protein